MAELEEEFDTEYLRAEDLIRDGEWQRMTLTIKAGHAAGTFQCAAERKKGSNVFIDKQILEFNEIGKKLIVGKLNWRLMRYALGLGYNERRLCVGRSITLYVAEGNWTYDRKGAKGGSDRRRRRVALRIHVPEEYLLPELNRTQLGKEVTGQKFNVANPVTPQSHVPEKKEAAAKPTLEQSIQAQKDPKALLALLLQWTAAKPVATNAEAWKRVVAATTDTAETWPRTDDRDSLMKYVLAIELEIGTPVGESQ